MTEPGLHDSHVPARRREIELWIDPGHVHGLVIEKLIGDEIDPRTAHLLPDIGPETVAGLEALERLKRNLLLNLLPLKRKRRKKKKKTVAMKMSVEKKSVTEEEGRKKVTEEEGRKKKLEEEEIEKGRHPTSNHLAHARAHQ